MYRRATSSWVKHLDFIISDMVCLLVTFFIVSGIRNGFGYISKLYINTALVILLTDIFVVFFGESYKGIIRRGYWQEFKATVKHYTWVMGVLIFFLFITQSGQLYARSVFLMHWILGILSSYYIRIAWKKRLIEKGRIGEGNRSMLLVTSKDIVEDAVRTVQKNLYGQIRLIGVIIVDDEERYGDIEGVSIVARGVEGGLNYIRLNWVDEVFINLPKEYPELDKFTDGCMEMGVTVHLKLTKLLNAEKQVVEKVGGYTVLSSSINMASSKQLFVKRIMDICGGLVGLIFTGILFIVVAPIIYIQSPGPIFFGQERIGKNGKRFKLYKFRSMYLDAEARKAELMMQNEMGSGLMFKIEDDPRIIGGEHGIGNFIRKTSIDEFPQFWNVLKGDMSLVGTRPPTIDEWEQYEKHHRKRLSTKPGITGMWQVSGRSNIKDFEEVVKLDTEYISNWDLSTDFRILFKTVMVVLMKDGSV